MNDQDAQQIGNALNRIADLLFDIAASLRKATKDEPEKNGPSIVGFGRDK